MKKKRKKQRQNALTKDSENQTGEKLKFRGLSPIKDFEELLRKGKLERVPGTDDLYKLKQPCA